MMDNGFKGCSGLYSLKYTHVHEVYLAFIIGNLSEKRFYRDDAIQSSWTIHLAMGTT